MEHLKLEKRWRSKSDLLRNFLFSLTWILGFYAFFLPEAFKVDGDFSQKLNQDAAVSKTATFIILNFA